jgi:hypothetical protein
MDERPGGGINGRAVSSLFMFFSFLLLIPSGILLHVFSSDQFESHRHVFMTVHNVCALVFVVSGSVHLFRNRKAVRSYMHAKSAEYRAFSRELILVTLIFTALLTLALLHIAIIG